MSVDSQLALRLGQWWGWGWGVVGGGRGSYWPQNQGGLSLTRGDKTGVEIEGPPQLSLQRFAGLEDGWTRRQPVGMGVGEGELGSLGLDLVGEKNRPWELLGLWKSTTNVI